MKSKFFLGLLISLTLLSGCTILQPTPTVELPELHFVPKLSMYKEGVVHFEVGVKNEAMQDQPLIKDINIEVVVTNEEGEIQNRMSIVDLGSVPAGENIYPLSYEARYPIGSYEMEFTGKDIPTLKLNFEIREEEGSQKLAVNPEWLDPFTEFTISDPDL